MALEAVEERGYVAIPRGEARGTPRRRVLPAYSLAKEMEGFGTVYGDIAPKSPLPIQLRHAYLSSPEIRQSILEGWKGETFRIAIGPADRKPKSMILREGETAVTIVSPVEKFVRAESGLWQAEGKRKIAKLPAGDRWQGPDGNIFWDEHGFPARSYSSRPEAIAAWEKAEFSPEEAKNLASYFWRRSEYKDFAAVYRFSYPVYGPWSLSADWSPDDGYGRVGFRAVSGLPSAERSAGLG
ncbi:MAG: hypothetical protein HYW25_04725 [Candidatus Aenigmarchaeota archaeon]|nr:hypothetical protein [Candidatus Aenigmarchaeota archaeon]